MQITPGCSLFKVVEIFSGYRVKPVSMERQGMFPDASMARFKNDPEHREFFFGIPLRIKQQQNDAEGDQDSPLLKPINRAIIRFNAQIFYYIDDSHYVPK